MSIVKTFTELESIAQALNLMSSYPINERPLLLIKIQYYNRMTKYIEGILDCIEGNRVIIKNSFVNETDYALLNTIVELTVFDERVY